MGGPGAILPALFSEEAVEAMRILMQHRKCLGIYKRNKYIFASGELYLKGRDALQAVTWQVANLEKPHLITPVGRRTFLVTMLLGIAKMCTLHGIKMDKVMLI